MTPTDAAIRKALPLATGVLDYFPDALLAVAQCSKTGNDQHNPGKPLHWDKSKSQDEPDALLRHLIDRGTIDTDGVRHSAKVAWRALAMLQREIESDRAMVDNVPRFYPLGPGQIVIPAQTEADLDVIRDSNDHAHYVPKKKMGVPAEETPMMERIGRWRDVD